MRWTTLTSLILFIPLLLILVVLKVEVTYRQPEDDNGVGIYLANKKTIDNLAYFISPSQSNCKCDCDKSVLNGDAVIATGQASALLDTTISSILVQGDDPDASSSETGSVTTVLPSIQSLKPIISSTSLPPPSTIYVITPTYTRPTQMADMTRLAQTLKLVPNIFWIVTEDAHVINEQVAELLNRTAIPYVQLLGPRPKTHLDKRSGRGVSNRLVALDWLRLNFVNNPNEQGVIYFADDDNAYDIRIFEEMRDTKKVSVWPVGLIAKLGVSTPILNSTTNKVIGFHDPFISRRKFAVDMAGFAVNLGLFLSTPKATMPYKVGYEEDYFIRSLGVTLDDLEPKASNCTKVLVWHTKTQPGVLPTFVNLKKEKVYNSTNLVQLYNNVLQL